MDVRTPPAFATDAGELSEFLVHAKHWRCPHCGREGTLIGHGQLSGYGEAGAFPVLRGRRLLCSSKRRKNPGCGRTCSTLLAGVIRGFVLRTVTLLRFIVGVIGGQSRRAAWQTTGTTMTLSTGYRLWRRFGLAQSRLRSQLAARCAPPACSSPEPLAQLLAHLHLALPDAKCVLSDFQVTFQADLLG